MDMDMEDMIAIAKAQEDGEENGEGLDESGDEGAVSGTAKAGKEGKKGKKKGGRVRNSKDLLKESEEQGEEQLGGEGASGDVDKEVPDLVETVHEAMNATIGANLDVHEYTEKPKKREGPNGTTKKRKRKSGDSDTSFEPEESVPEVDVSMLVEFKTTENKGKNTRSRKSRSALMEEDANEDEPTQLRSKNNPVQHLPTQDVIAEDGEESVISNLVGLPNKLRRAKKKAKMSPHKSIEAVIAAAAVEDDDDSAAALHRPLAPAHTEHHRTSSNAQEKAVAQLQKDADQRAPADPEEELGTTPNKPSQKALGKRKASDIGVNTSKKRKTQKDKAAGTPELMSFGFSVSSETQRRATPVFTPINGPRASILPPPGQRPPVDPLADDDSDSDEYVPEPAVPKSSERKKKRRLPVGDDEVNPKTPQNKGSRNSKTPKSASKTSQPKAPATTGKGRLSNEEIEAITTAVETYSYQNDLTQVEINDLIQKGAKTDDFGLWKHIYEEVPDIPRRQIQQLCRRRFHNFEARGSWTDEQDQELREAYEKYPNKWKQIGETVHRFPEDCRDRWRNYLVCGDNMRKDAWDKEEEERFKEVVQECIEMVREMKRVSTDPRDKAKSDDSLVDWNVVSQKMDHTRSRLQCINKWKKIKDREEVVVDDPVLAKPISETWRIEEAEHVARKMKAKEKLLLLYAVRESGAGREGKIPWKRVQEDVPGKPRKMAMRVAFRQMRQHIEDNEDMALQDIVDLLIDAFEASVPAEPPGFDDDFERFRSSQKILSKKTKNKSKDEIEVESSSDGNSEGPSTITKPKRKTRLSEKYVVDKDNEEDDIWAIPRDEQPSTSKSKRRQTSSSLQAESDQAGSSVTKNKQKLRERMKSIGQSQGQSQERDDQHDSEVSDVYTALETLKTGNSRARRAAAKEATKSKSNPFRSDERVVENDEEEQPQNEQPYAVRAAKAKHDPFLAEHFPSEERGVESDEERRPASDEEQFSNDAIEVDEQPAVDEERWPVIEEEQPANEDMAVHVEESLVDELQYEEPIANGKPVENEEEQSADEEEPPVNSELSENGEEPTANEDLEADEDEMDLDRHDAAIAPEVSEANEDELLADRETQSENEDELSGNHNLEADADAMDVDNHDTYTAPGGPAAEDDDSFFDGEADKAFHDNQESADLSEIESEEETTNHHDNESVDLDAARLTSADEEPIVNGESSTNGVYKEVENPGSDAETDFHGFQEDAGSDTSVQSDHRKKVASPVPFEKEPPKVNGLTNGHRHKQIELEERVSSDDDDMSDIPAKIAPKVKVLETKKGKRTKKEKKSKSKKQKRPMGFR
jgi:hypothetical protein